jgi:hypothetical protein
MHKGKLVLNLPNRPKDDEVEVFPFGLFKNGYSYEVNGLTNALGEEVDELVLGNPEAKLPDPIPEDVASDVSNETDQSPPVRSEDTAASSTPESDTNEGGDE